MNAHAQVRTPYGDACRKRDAIKDVRERYWRIHMKLVNRLNDEIGRIEREGVR